MPTELHFYSWWRDSSHGGARLVGDRLVRRYDVELVESDAGGGVIRRASGSLETALAGLQDVTGLDPAAITRRYPLPGVRNAEETKLAMVEFADHRLPWRYTPAATAASSMHLRPWLVLVVATTEETELGDQRATVAETALLVHPLAESHFWAHVQADDDGPSLSRIMSPRGLEADTDYVALLVPAYRHDGTSLVDSWSSAGVAATPLPVFDSWTFRTGRVGDFLSLARALKPGLAAPTTGRSPLVYRDHTASDSMVIRGALAPASSVDAPVPSPVQADLDAALEVPLADAEGRPVIGLPRYGKPWADATATWQYEANRDPRHRGAAGLGQQVGISFQRRLTDLATTGLGAVEEANQRIRILALGIEAANSLWRRRLPASDEEQLLLFGPAMGRLVTEDGIVLELVGRRDRPAGRALFSSAGRRVLRRGPSRTDLANSAASDPVAIVREANRCPAVPPWPSGLPNPSSVLAEETLENIEALADSDVNSGHLKLRDLDQAPQPRDPNLSAKLIEFITKHLDSGDADTVPLSILLWLLALASLPSGASREADEIWQELAEFRECLEGADTDWTSCLEGAGIKIGAEEDWRDLGDLFEGFGAAVPRACRPLSIDVLATGLRRAFDPHPASGPPRVAERVYATLDGVNVDPELDPITACPNLEIPTYELLRDVAPHWLLPGAGQLERDSVIAVESNRSFIEAFLIGLNQQLLDELRWRAVAVNPVCTALSRFWDRRSRTDGSPVPDISDIASWSTTAALGSNVPGGSTATDLVVVVRGDLFHRYPDTIVVLHPRSSGDWDPPADPRDTSQDLYPDFRGRLGSDITFFGFGGLSAGDAVTHWLILEEPWKGLSFRDPMTTTVATTAAEFADETIADPIRVLIRGDRMIPR